MRRRREGLRCTRTACSFSNKVFAFGGIPFRSAKRERLPCRHGLFASIHAPGWSTRRAYSDQVFNEDETISGFEGLSVDVFLSAATLRPYVSVQYEKKSEHADNVEQILKKHFGKRM